MYSQSTSGSTQPGERPVTARSGDVSSTRQNTIMGHATEEEKLSSEDYYHPFKNRAGVLFYTVSQKGSPTFSAAT